MPLLKSDLFLQGQVFTLNMANNLCIPSLGRMSNLTLIKLCAEMQSLGSLLCVDTICVLFTIALSIQNE
jgi:hypothetical protein